MTGNVIQPNGSGNGFELIKKFTYTVDPSSYAAGSDNLVHLFTSAELDILKGSTLFLVEWYRIASNSQLVAYNESMHIFVPSLLNGLNVKWIVLGATDKPIGIDYPYMEYKETSGLSVNIRRSNSDYVGGNIVFNIYIIP